jgi:hypothetical protein
LPPQVGLGRGRSKQEGRQLAAAALLEQILQHAPPSEVLQLPRQGAASGAGFGAAGSSARLGGPGRFRGHGHRMHASPSHMRYQHPLAGAQAALHRRFGAVPSMLLAGAAAPATPGAWPRLADGALAHPAVYSSGGGGMYLAGPSMGPSSTYSYGPAAGGYGYSPGEGMLQQAALEHDAGGGRGVGVGSSQQQLQYSPNNSGHLQHQHDAGRGSGSEAPSPQLYSPEAVQQPHQGQGGGGQDAMAAMLMGAPPPAAAPCALRPARPQQLLRQRPGLPPALARPGLGCGVCCALC